MTDPAPPTPTHPLDTLVAEHRTIERVLDVLEREVRRDGDLDRRRWADALAFIEGYADRRHHGKEEEHLFPALAASGFEPGLLEVMDQEHTEGRELVGRMRAALAGDDVGTLHRAARAYTALLREHIEKEDRILFPAAREWLSAQGRDDLDRGFRAVDQALGDDGCAALAGRLAGSGE